MKSRTAVSVSVGILVWAWTFLSFTYLEPRVLTWITFLTWATFYAAGAGSSGLTKSIASGITGALASASVIWIDHQLGVEPFHVVILSGLLGILGWFLCAIASTPVLSCIPASFIGAAAFFGAGAPMDTRLLWILGSIFIGSLLGLASQKLAGVLTRRSVPVPSPSVSSTE